MINSKSFCRNFHERCDPLFFFNFFKNISLDKDLNKIRNVFNIEWDILFICVYKLRNFENRNFQF